MKKLILLLLLFPCVALSQSIPTGGEMIQSVVRFGSITDSAKVMNVPAGSAIVGLWMVEDSTGTGETAPLAIAVSGGDQFYSDEALLLTETMIRNLLTTPYIALAARELWIYTGHASGQIRIIAEFRQLR